MRGSNVCFRAELSFIARLDRAAAAERRTRSNLILKVLSEYLERHHPDTT